MSALVQTDEVVPLRQSSQDRLLAMIQQKHPGYHPVLSMVKIAIDEETAPAGEGDRSLAFQCHKEVAKYVVAVDRVSEIKSEVIKTKRVVVEMFGGAPDANNVARPIDRQYATLENQPAEVLAAREVEDAEVKRTMMVESGQVQGDEDRPVLSAFLDEYEEPDGSKERS